MLHIIKKIVHASAKFNVSGWNKMQSMKDSVETSVSLKLFSSPKVASFQHIFNSKLIKLPISKCRSLNNFNPMRMSENPYPTNDRPRGRADLESVAHHRKLIRKQGQTEPIWIAYAGGEYFLLDGAHRIAATYLENKRSISCYLVEV
jgi:hypothetical protein